MCQPPLLLLLEGVLDGLELLLDEELLEGVLLELLEEEEVEVVLLEEDEVEEVLLLEEVEVEEVLLDEEEVGVVLVPVPPPVPFTRGSITTVAL